MLPSGCKDLCNTTGTRGSLGRAGKDDFEEAYPDSGGPSGKSLNSPDQHKTGGRN